LGYRNLMLTKDCPMPEPRPLNVFFVGEPRTVEAVRMAIAGLERVKHSPPEDAAFVAEATISQIMHLVKPREPADAAAIALAAAI
jgi:hypothetical protein